VGDGGGSGSGVLSEACHAVEGVFQIQSFEENISISIHF
jgi:hypothetical protein